MCWLRTVTSLYRKFNKMFKIAFLELFLISWSGVCVVLTYELKTLTPEELNKIRNITQCSYRQRYSRIEERGKYMVYYNIIPAKQQFKCYESLTLATQCDYSYLDNVITLVGRWQGPISITIYAPGDDFQKALDSIGYLRNCKNPLIMEYVTFHLFHDREHYPKAYKTGIYKTLKQFHNKQYSCNNMHSPYNNIKKESLYKFKKHLPYPINVARNIALESAQTHFVFTSDVELIPSEGIIVNFLSMIARNSALDERHRHGHHIYAVAVFEITKGSNVPNTKSELQSLYRKNKASFFHWIPCKECHGIPNPVKWINTPETNEFNIAATVKRIGKFKRWEPFYIGTHSEPPFDERVTWEGGSNKMIQDFVLCLLNYNIHVLNNAFLVHNPGRSVRTIHLKENKVQMAQMIKNTIVPELEELYGKKDGCVVGGEYTLNIS